MSTNQPAASFFDELATFFASGPSPSAILEFRPSPATVERARQLLELNRSGTLDEASRIELDQFEMAESLMRLVKARIHAGQARERSQQSGGPFSRWRPPVTIEPVRQTLNVI